jgi:hypothetical protein
MKTDEELKKIVEDLIANRIYMSDQIKDQGMLHMVFLVLAMMTEEQAKDFMEKDYAVCYEYLDKASPRQINGMPMFMSANFLTREEYKRVYEMEAEVRKAMKAALEKSSAPSSSG